MADLLLALDQGTTSTRAILFGSELARPHAVAQAELTQHFPAPAWVEHEPEEIWSGSLAVLREALARGGAAARAVAGLGITNQRETTLVWDRATGRAIHRAIVWQDRRTAAACARLEAEGHAPLIAARTGLLPDPYFSATKLAWLLDETPGARQKAESGALAAGTLDSFTLFKLSAGRLFVTDPSTSCRTLLARLSDGQFSDELCALFRVPREVLGSVVPSDAELGDLSFAGKPLLATMSSGASVKTATPRKSWSVS